MTVHVELTVSPSPALERTLSGGTLVFALHACPRQKASLSLHPLSLNPPFTHMPLKSLVLVFSAAVVLVSASVAEPERPSDDRDAIRATVSDYIEGYYLNDVVRMERSLHPQYLKHTVYGPTGDSQTIVKTGMEMVREVRDKEAITPVADRKEEISIFGLEDDVASVRLVATRWTNYMTLCKQGGEWKILSVVKRNQE